MEDNSQNANQSSHFRGVAGYTITIEYCPKCGWMMRAAYMAQELLTTFTGDIHGVMLRPSEINGRYTIRINDTEIFDRKRVGRFPEIKELKQLVRDVVSPEKDLGHSDKKI
ncbi:SelT/SelW/SelH family protein [Mucilaginibacter sp. AW1-3]